MHLYQEEFHCFIKWKLWPHTTHNKNSVHIHMYQLMLSHNVSKKLFTIRKYFHYLLPREEYFLVGHESFELSNHSTCTTYWFIINIYGTTTLSPALQWSQNNFKTKTSWILSFIYFLYFKSFSYILFNTTSR